MRAWEFATVITHECQQRFSGGKAGLSECVFSLLCVRALFVLCAWRAPNFAPERFANDIPGDGRMLVSLWLIISLFLPLNLLLLDSRLSSSGILSEHKDSKGFLTLRFQAWKSDNLGINLVASWCKRVLLQGFAWLLFSKEKWLNWAVQLGRMI